ncbi:hypothetical protein ES705_20211 [subsurface metagenome]
MNQNLDKRLQQWLSKLADDWARPIDQVAMSIAADEIHNRLQNYPNLSSVLSNPVLELDKISNAARNCWALGGRYDLIHFGDFITKDESAGAAIERLVRAFPADDTEAIMRIDHFVDQAVHLGYSKPSGSADWAGAALLSSVILTSVYPDRFVDFRQSRWIRFAKTFGYHHPPSGERHFGEKLIWAGKFAADISRAKTFRQYWPESEPLWIIAGLCWTGPTPPKPEPEPTDIEEIESFPEGAEKRRLHLTRERNQVVILKAKELGLKRDPMLRCAVCGFSFIETYGEHGWGFIEAHHTQPVATLKPGSQTKVEDIALICGNCHRVIHRGERTLSIDDLRNMLQR